MNEEHSELLETYDIDGTLQGVIERKEFYAQTRKEFKDTGKIIRQVKRVVALVMDPQGKVYCQKRSKVKDVNAGLYDKTIGGHVIAGSSYDVTIVKECVEELGMPVVVVPVPEFKGLAQSIDLRIIGILKQIDYVAPFESERIEADGSHFIQPFMTTVYAGYYSGPIRFSATESSGIEVFSVDDLNKEIQQQQGRFTHDLSYMIKKYKDYLIPLP